MVSIHEPHNSIIYLILDSLYFDVFFANRSLFLSFLYNIPPFAHTPLRQLADFLQRGRCDGQYTRAAQQYNIPYIGLLLVIYSSMFFRLFFANRSLFLYCSYITSPLPPFKGGDVMVSIHEKLCQRCFNSIICLIYQLFILRCFFGIPVSFSYNIPPFAHTPLRQLADFLQRGRCDGQYTRAAQQYNIPYIGLLLVIYSSMFFRLFFANRSLFLYCSYITSPLPPFKGGDVMVSKHEKLCQRCFKGGDVMVSIHEQHNSIIYLLYWTLISYLYFYVFSLIVR